MRSKATNVLQVIIIIAGMIYISIGLFFYLSPLHFARFLSINITDDWFNAIQSDTFVAPLYFMARAFAAMLFSAGLAMILPLFDPLKYRGLVYYNAVIFPLLSSGLLLYEGVKYDHLIIIISGIIFFIICVSAIIGLAITGKDARAGVE